MAELATIARPYAEALFKAGADGGVDVFPWKQQLDSLAALAASHELCQFADNPKVAPVQVFDLIAGVALQKGLSLDAKVANLLRTVLDNGRLSALPEIAAQFSALVSAKSGVADAVIHSAYPIDAGQLADVSATLEKRFGRKLNASVVVDESLIGGIRVVVGDEVLDTSVKARLEHMRIALTA
jgi:F-type H+-transporting ATPase subunit delta